MKTRQQLKEISLTIVGMVAASLAMSNPAHAQDPERPTFTSSVAVVPITAVVRDSRNRVVRNLERKDFEVLEQGAPRRIVEFSSDDGPVSLAFLFDTSGSMGVASNLEKGREAIAQLLWRMQPARDEAALFTFQKRLREEVPFTTDRDRVQRALNGVTPWGLTSLYDAVAETAKRVTDRPAARRAVVVVSDGLDTSSELSSRQVAALASEIDVPVYVIAVVSPLEDPTRPGSIVQAKASGGLAELASFTGGDVFYVSAVATAWATEKLLTTLRHQYFLAIESASAPGWYPLEVKTKRQGLNVRARRAYSAGEMAADNPRHDK